MSISDRDARIRWEDVREQDLWDFMQRRLQDGFSITAALKEYGSKHDMSWLTARWKYYQIRSRKDGADASPRRPGPKPGGRGQRQTKGASDKDFLGYMTDLIEGSSQSGEDLVPMMRGLSRLAMLSSEGIRLREALKERDKRAESAVFEAEKVRVERDRAKEHLSRICAFLEEWLASSAVERVGSLKEFSERLQVLLDAVVTQET